MKLTKTADSKTGRTNRGRGGDGSNDVRHENLGRLLMDSFRFFRDRTRVNLHAHGLTELSPVHAAMMRRLEAQGTRVGEIAVRMGVSKQAAAQLVARAAALGYVTCVIDPGDSRAKIVRCTPKGGRFLGSLNSVVEDSVRDVETIIGSENLHHLESILSKIAAQERTADLVAIRDGRAGKAVRRRAGE